MLCFTFRNGGVCWLALLLLVWPSAAPAADDLAALEEQAMRAAVERAAPSVVRIETIGGKERVGEVLIGTGPTTGLIVDADGYVVSSAFNFAQEPSSILITLPGGERKPAQIVARDKSRMLVLLKVEADEKLPTPEAAPLDSMQVGQWAIAVGRTFPGDKPHQSVGIVSAVDRMFGKAVQTDAKISPNNYGGPLLDIQGRVLGVLVPLSPQGASEVAGVEWYDGGIGFAVPLATILERLPTLKQGKDLAPGILGVTLGQGDPYVEPAKLTGAQPNSPALAADLRAGDTVVEVAGKPVATHMQLKIQLGRYYAGDKLGLVVLRDGEQLTKEVELVESLPPFEHAFLGLLPQRAVNGGANAAKGIAIRYVYPDGPAAKAGLEMGDVVTKIADQAVESPADAVRALSRFTAGDKVQVDYSRDGETKRAELTTAQLPTALPGDLPPAHAKLEGADGARPPVGVSRSQLPEFKHPFELYVPENYDPRLSYGVVVWLHGPGGDEEKQVIERWRPLCKLHDLILVVPGSDSPNQWERSEAEYIARVLANVKQVYNVDPSRVVLHGYQAGGAMAYLVGLRDRKNVSAVAVVDAPVPASLDLPENDPQQRLAFLTTKSSKSRFAGRIEQGIAALEGAKYPVTVLDQGDEVRYLKPEELLQVARWIDALDRF